jgi:hypothetical protein
VAVTDAPGLGVEIDVDALERAHRLYLARGDAGGGRDDAVAMRYLISGWTFDPKRPCMVRA